MVQTATNSGGVNLVDLLQQTPMADASPSLMSLLAGANTGGGSLQIMPLGPSVRTSSPEFLRGLQTFFDNNPEFNFFPHGPGNGTVGNPAVGPGTINNPGNPQPLPAPTPAPGPAPQGGGGGGGGGAPAAAPPAAANQFMMGPNNSIIPFVPPPQGVQNVASTVGATAPPTPVFGDGNNIIAWSFSGSGGNTVTDGNGNILAQNNGGTPGDNGGAKRGGYAHNGGIQSLLGGGMPQPQDVGPDMRDYNEGFNYDLRYMPQHDAALDPPPEYMDVHEYGLGSLKPKTPQDQLQDALDRLRQQKELAKKTMDAVGKKLTEKGFQGGGLSSLPGARNYNMGHLRDRPRTDYAVGGGVRDPYAAGRRDTVPALLDDGEFVMTKNAVEKLGGGNPALGAKRMYQMMRKLENLQPTVRPNVGRYG